MKNKKKEPIHETMIRIGLLFIVLAIVLGSASAHVLESNGVMPDNIASFETGIRYQMYAGLGLLLLVALRDFFKFSLMIPALLLIFGTTLFCLAVYLITTQAMHNIPVGGYFSLSAPIGGGMMIGAWMYIFVRFLIQKK